jgi:hypothetical protein
MSEPPIPWKHLAVVGAVWSLVALIINLYEVFFVDPATISFRVGLSLFFFCILGPILWLVAALNLATAIGLKRWPLWFMFIHPVVSVVIYWAVNREKLQLQRPNP